MGRQKSKKCIAPDYRKLYKQTKDDLKVCKQTLKSVHNQLRIANEHANAVTRELLIRMAE